MESATKIKRYFTSFSFVHHGKKRFWVYTAIENKASNLLVQSLDFRLANKEHHRGGGKYNYYLYEMD
jgi:hypothetical protein